MIAHDMSGRPELPCVGMDIRCRARDGNDVRILVKAVESELRISGFDRRRDNREIPGSRMRENEMSTGGEGFVFKAPHLIEDRGGMEDGAAAAG